MSSTVFILGAGASQDSGAPLMADFLDVAKDLWKRKQVEDAGGDYQAVFEGIAQLQLVHSKAEMDITNIESVFAAFEMCKTLGTYPGGGSGDIEKLLASLRKVIVRTLEQSVRLRLAEDGRVYPSRSYGDFARLIDDLGNRAEPPQSVAVLTFNYDLALDYALHAGAVEYHYGLDLDRTHKGIPVLKLHGSLNWGECKECRKVVPVTLGEYFNKASWQIVTRRIEPAWKTLPIGSRLHEFSHCGTGMLTDQPVIVPPTWHKEDYHKAVASVWSRAAGELRDAENIFVIGYSLPNSDAFFRYLYGLGTVGTTTLERFWVFNPDATGTTQNRFKSLLGPGALARYKYEESRFEVAVDAIRKAMSVPRRRSNAG